jgi:hypothetical protein
VRTRFDNNGDLLTTDGLFVEWLFIGDVVGILGHESQSLRKLKPGITMPGPCETLKK